MRYCGILALPRAVLRYSYPPYAPPLFGARQYGATTRENSDPDLELSTPAESRHTTCLPEGKNPSVKLMSRREKIKNWPKPTSKTWTEPCTNYSISELKNIYGPKIHKVQTLTTKDFKGPQTNMPKNVYVGSMKT